MLLIAAAGISVLGIGLFQAGAGLGGGRTGIVGATASPGPGVANPSLDPAGSPGASAGSSAAPQPSAPAGGPTPGTPSTAERRHAVLGVRLQAELDRVRAKLAIPGASVAITFPDGWTWSGSSGLADIAAKTPVTPNTAFAYASISKTFTSALILQLVDAGALRLTDSAAGLLPPLRLAIDRRITVAMLLDHTSGLADYFLNPKIDRPLQARPNATWTVDQALRYVGKRLAPPGKAWHYSNTNYLLLGLIAERVTGQPLATAIRTRLLDPNGLAATWSQPDETARLPLAHGYRFNGTKLTARAIDLADGSGIAPFRSVVTAAGGAGSMAGTTGDLVTWARALYGGRVLGPTGTAMLLSGFTKTTAYLPGVAYGYGIQALSIDGHASLGHSGRLLGFRGAVRHFPIDGLTIAVLTNQSRADAGVLVQALLAVALPTSPACPACPTAR
jgi:D-alanyl-D-alanine carboxypeptidase